MPPLDFPNSPTTGQIFDSWVFDSVKWTSGVGSGVAYLPLAGGTLTGALSGITAAFTGVGTALSVTNNAEALRLSLGTHGGNPSLFDGSTPLAIANNPTFSGSGWGNSVNISSNGAGTTSHTGQQVWNLFNTVDGVKAASVQSIANIANYYTLSGSAGSRIAQQISLLVSGATTDVAGSYHMALGASCVVNANMGGTSSAYAGAPFGANITCTLEPGATYVTGVAGLEVDVSAQAGSSLQFKTGVTVVLQSNDAVESANPSCAIGIGMSTDSPNSKGFAYGMVWGGHNGWWPMNPTTGVLLFVDANAQPSGPAYHCQDGIDFSAVTFSGHFLKSTGFSVDGSGNVAAAELLVGSGNTLSGGSTIAGIGPNNTLGVGSVGIGGYNNVNALWGVAAGLSNLVSGSASFVCGNGASDHGRAAAFVFSSSGNVTGGNQVCRQTLRCATANATPVRATADGNAAAGGNVFNLGNYSACRLSIRVIGTGQTTGAATSWLADGMLAARGGTPASTTMTAATFTQGGSSGTVTGWSVAATADTTNGGINVTCTGPATEAVHWTALIEGVEVV